MSSIEAHYHHPSDMKNLATLRRHTPESFRAFGAFDAAALHAESNTIPRKYLELMATAVGLTTQCVYCIEGHVRAATQEGASTAEVAETVMITAALRAGGGLVHGRHALALATAPAEGAGDQAEDHKARGMAALRRGAPSAFNGFVQFNKAALHGENNTISRKYTELIAVAVALTTQCMDCIAAHTAAAQTEGATTAELAETIFVATALRAGAGVAHGMMALKFHLDEASAQAENEKERTSA
ncbi:carboxymuconolactone decarboxylase family protein [Pseudarthrobacter sp. P1]|uniref:carboxymuconolactone decarboxylase family protein n=1 Tax=Pseudarthrobacter sp. P1 TaxID=3418418 RepID=UPI003CF81129